MKTFCTFLAGVSVAVLLVAAAFSGSIRRARMAGEREGRAAVIREAVLIGNAVAERPENDPRGFKWIIRKEARHAEKYAGEYFIATDEPAVIASK